jgi:hypothetical protein
LEITGTKHFLHLNVPTDEIFVVPKLLHQQEFTAIAKTKQCMGMGIQSMLLFFLL